MKFNKVNVIITILSLLLLIAVSVLGYIFLGWYKSSIFASGYEAAVLNVYSQAKDKNCNPINLYNKDDKDTKEINLINIDCLKQDNQQSEQSQEQKPVDDKK